MSWQEGCDLGGSVPGYQGYFSDFLGWVYDVEEVDQVSCIHAGTNLYTNGISYSPEEFHMRTIQLSGPVSDPEEVC